MSKRAADDEGIAAPLKGGDRPEAMDVDKDHDMGEFEDDFEDEFESEDEIIEAGVDGRPDAEREAEEGMTKLSFIQLFPCKPFMATDTDLIRDGQAPWT